MFLTYSRHKIFIIFSQFILFAVIWFLRKYYKLIFFIPVLMIRKRYDNSYFFVRMGLINQVFFTVETKQTGIYNTKYLLMPP